MSVTIIQQAIKDKLDEQIGIGKPLATVYEDHEYDISGYPSATFEPSHVISDYETTTSDRTKWPFRIVLHQQSKTISKVEAIKRINNALGTILYEFQKDYQLGNTCDMLKINPGVRGIYHTGGKPVVYAEILVECWETTNITI